MSFKLLSEKAMEKGEGVFRLMPAWVPRSFCRPGRRIKLHPEDYYIHGLKRGAIDERWLTSTTRADNGPNTPEDEGYSYVVIDETGQERILLKEVIDYLKQDIIGEHLWKIYGGWDMFSKFFDNMGPLPHHVHHRNEHAEKVGQKGKPEMYFFPAQMNNHGGEFPFTFFGVNPECTKSELKHILKNFTKGDNKLLDVSRAYKLTLDTGWDVPPGILHAPGSLCTYEPQFASDVYAMYQSVLYYNHVVPEELLWKNCPEEMRGDFDYLVEVLDWELNTDPDFHKNRFMPPVYAVDPTLTAAEGYIDEWICYKCATVSAKRLTILPGKTVTVKDSIAYGLILLQGYGLLDKWKLETPTLIRYGQATNDEFFVTEAKAKKGVMIKNLSQTEPIVMLKHFLNNPENAANNCTLIT